MYFAPAKGGMPVSIPSCGVCVFVESTYEILLIAVSLLARIAAADTGVFS
jgi:hypothetical protein